jgi:hypothetical protein
MGDDEVLQRRDLVWKTAIPGAIGPFSRVPGALAQFPETLRPLREQLSPHHVEVRQCNAA